MCPFRDQILQPDAYSEPRQTSMTKLFGEIVNDCTLLTIFVKRFILDVWLGCECASENCCECMYMAVLNVTFRQKSCPDIFFPEKQNLRTKMYIFWPKKKIYKYTTQDHHTVDCFLVFSVFVQAILLNYSFHSCVIEYAIWYLNDDSLLHVYILLPFKRKQTIFLYYCSFLNEAGFAQ